MAERDRKVRCPGRHMPDEDMERGPQQPGAAGAAAQVKCPHCGQPYTMSDEQRAQYAGRAIACITCRRQFTITGAPGEPPIAAPVASPMVPPVAPGPGGGYSGAPYAGAPGMPPRPGY